MKPVRSVRRPALPPCCRGPDRDAKSRTLPCSLGGFPALQRPSLCESAHAGFYTGACGLFRGDQPWEAVMLTRELRYLENSSQQGSRSLAATIYTATYGLSPWRSDSVKISTPPGVTPTECSNCADSE